MTEYRYTRNPRPRTSVVWQGFTFVPITSRTRAAQSVVEVGRIFALCPNNFIAVSSESLFKRGKPQDPEQFSEALFKLGLINSERKKVIDAEIEKEQAKNCEARKVRDLKNAINETGLYTSADQVAAIKKFYPDWSNEP